MTKWANSSVLDTGPESIRTLAGTPGRVKQHLIEAYDAEDSYASVVANSVAVANVALADLVMSTSSSNRVMTVAEIDMGNATATSSATPDIHLALVDSVGSTVLLVTDETSNQPITSGNPVTAPSWAYTVLQPT